MCISQLVVQTPQGVLQVTDSFIRPQLQSNQFPPQVLSLAQTALCKFVFSSLINLGLILINVLPWIFLYSNVLLIA